MTLSEFKAWFEGFTESMDGPPSLKQWERIQARVKEISGAAITERVFIDRYSSPRLDNHLVGGIISSSTSLAAQPRNAMIGGTELGANSHMARFDARTRSMDATDTVTFDSHSAMNALGKADAEALKAA